MEVVISLFLFLFRPIRTPPSPILYFVSSRKMPALVNDPQGNGMRGRKRSSAKWVVRFLPVWCGHRVDLLIRWICFIHSLRFCFLFCFIYSLLLLSQKSKCEISHSNGQTHGNTSPHKFALYLQFQNGNLSVEWWATCSASGSLSRAFPDLLLLLVKFTVFACFQEGYLQKKRGMMGTWAQRYH